MQELHALRAVRFQNVAVANGAFEQFRNFRAQQLIMLISSVGVPGMGTIQGRQDATLRLTRGVEIL
eukprot:2756528-Pyramimonas_sp.AAC.1